MKTTDPAGEQPARVSPTAPSSKSPSHNVWRLLEQNEAFREGMAAAEGEHERGEFAPFKHRTPRPTG